MLKTIGWMLYWSIGAIGLVALHLFDEADVKAFLTQVGFAPVYVLVTGYFLVPVLLLYAVDAPEGGYSGYRTDRTHSDDWRGRDDWGR